MPRYKLTPLIDLPANLTEGFSEVAHEGSEDSLSQRLNDLHALTGVPFEANEVTEEDEVRDSQEQRAELDRKHDETGE